MQRSKPCVCAALWGTTLIACAASSSESPSMVAYRAHLSALQRPTSIHSAAPTRSPSATRAPGDVLDLSFWKLTLPAGEPGKPAEIKWPALRSFVHDEYFFVDAQTRAVVFRAPAGGVTTAHSKYPRSELREMAGGGLDKASWSTTRGHHVLTVTEAITHLPLAKPEVVAAQIHDATDDVIMIRLEREHLFVEADGKPVARLEPAYPLGTPFSVRIEAAHGHIRVTFNDAREPLVDLPRAVDECYFKAGAYTQSNPIRGDAPSAYGEVTITRLDVAHTSD